MKRALIVGGSIGAVVLLVLAGIPSVVSSNTVKEVTIASSVFSTIEKDDINKIQMIFLRYKEEVFTGDAWFPGYFLVALITFLWDTLMESGIWEPGDIIGYLGGVLLGWIYWFLVTWPTWPL